MAKSGPSSLNDHVATVRQLKVLVVLLVLSNIGLGAFSFYLLRNIDARYTELIDHTVPLMNDLQTLTAYSVDAMRGTNPGLFESPAAGLAETLKKSRAAIARDQELRDKALKSEWLPAMESSREDFQKAGALFTRTSGSILRLFEAGKSAEAGKIRDVELRPAFDRYIEALTKAADDLEAESVRVNNAFTARTSSVSTAILGLASWPVVLLLALLALTAVFVLVLMILFRGREVNEIS